MFRKQECKINEKSAAIFSRALLAGNGSTVHSCAEYFHIKAI